MKDNNWSEEFDEKFGGEGVIARTDGNGILIGFTHKEVKSFISEKLKEQRERIIEEIIETTKIIKAITQQSDDWYDGLTYEKDVIINKLKQ